MASGTRAVGVLARARGMQGRWQREWRKPSTIRMLALRTTVRGAHKGGKALRRGSVAGGKWAGAKTAKALDARSSYSCCGATWRDHGLYQQHQRGHVREMNTASPAKAPAKTPTPAAGGAPHGSRGGLTRTKPPRAADRASRYWRTAMSSTTTKSFLAAADGMTLGLLEAESHHDFLQRMKELQAMVRSMEALIGSRIADMAPALNLDGRVLKPIVDGANSGQLGAGLALAERAFVARYQPALHMEASGVTPLHLAERRTKSRAS